MKPIVTSILALFLFLNAAAQPGGGAAPQGMPGQMPEISMELKSALEMKDYKASYYKLGQEALDNYFKKNIKIDEKLNKIRLITSLIINANIDSLGNLSDFTINRSCRDVINSAYQMEKNIARKGELNLQLGFADDIDQEVIRVAKTLPAFVPAYNENLPIKSKTEIMVVIKNF